MRTSRPWPASRFARHEAGHLLDVAPAAIIELDPDGVVRQWNRACESLLGWPAGEVVGRPLPESILGRRPDLAALLARLQGGADPGLLLDLRCRHRNGQLLEVEGRAALTRDRNGRVRGAAVVLTDVTDRRRLERKLRYQAERDGLTHLPNRDALVTHLADTLAAARETGARTGLLVMDLDGFKEINTALGHAYGDQLLGQIGPRLLAGAVRDTDMVARLSGDEFAVVLPGLDGADGLAEAERAAERALAVLRRPFPIEGENVDVGVSIGVTLAPDHGDEPAALMRSADIALEEAKQGASGVVVYRTRPETPRGTTKFGLLGQLRRALEDRGRNELVVHYQPKVDMGTLATCGAEALVRWQHPTRGLLPPGEFIPVAESSGLVGPLTDRVLETAVAQARLWADRGHPIPVSVNLSARSMDDLSLPRRVRAVLARHGVPAELLCLEITETAIMQDPNTASIVLEELSTAGIALSLDDFGTGYSSMSYLQRLPVTELKIDRSFVTGLGTEQASEVLVRSTIELAHRLRLRVVAEGVEDSAALSVLRHLGCDAVQGYYYARPMPPDEFDAWAATRPSAQRNTAPASAGRGRASYRSPASQRSIR